jgi:hypothetical protein
MGAHRSTVVLRADSLIAPRSSATDRTPPQRASRHGSFRAHARAIPRERDVCADLRLRGPLELRRSGSSPGCLRGGTLERRSKARSHRRGSRVRLSLITPGPRELSVLPRIQSGCPARTGPAESQSGPSEPSTEIEKCAPLTVDCPVRAHAGAPDTPGDPGTLNTSSDPGGP